MSWGSSDNAGCINYKNDILQTKFSSAIAKTLLSAGDQYDQGERLRHRRFTNKCVFQHRVQVFETIVWRVTERRNLEEGGGKLWCALTEQDEQRRENYCRIDTGVRTADRGIISAGVLEMWTRILMFLCQDVLSQISQIWNTGRCEDRYPASQLFPNCSNGCQKFDVRI